MTAEEQARADLVLRLCAVKPSDTDEIIRIVMLALEEAAAQARVEERRAALQAISDIAAAEFDPDTAIVCGGKPTPHDMAQMGYGAACMLMLNAIRDRSTD